eukprot:TRINITY_DN10825_c0_g1_i1.p1 TRINITY_DN10825_c0_g1~~TRINITY_DN10825_c0_g1_i1.p1  ORF type:complete len:378 (+),score=24.12 TRINITY_DN10825_c0_g1_i1:336-1469(+)
MSYGLSRNNVWIVPLAKKDDPNSPVDESKWADNAFGEKGEKVAKKLRKYTGIFITGGDQSRIKDLTLEYNPETGKYEDGPILKTLREIYKTGGCIAGTSAGAAIQSNPMIGGGNTFGGLLQGATDVDNYEDAPFDERIFIAPGLGFWDDEEIMVGQHFVKRGRFGRLLAAMLKGNKTWGIGIDENTGFIVRGDVLEIVGESGAVLIDINDAEIKEPKLYQDENGEWVAEPIEAKDIKLSYLEPLDIFNYKQKKLVKTAYFKTLEMAGSEYYVDPVNIRGDSIMSPDILPRVLMEDVADYDGEANAWAMVIDWKGIHWGIEPGEGVLIKFKKGPDTNGWGGRNVYSGGHWESTAINIYMDIEPVKATIPGITDVDWGY